MAVRTQKLLEIQVNQALHTNISILTYLYPPHKDFWDVFKKDMFVKNNNSAFIHIVYYLLHILNPNRIKEKVRSWPVLDVQYERQFRSEVMKYLNQLNDIYENASMPSIMASQLVSPGGFRFAKYMLKLSMFVIRQILLNDVDLNRKMLIGSNLHKNRSKMEKQMNKIEILTGRIDQVTKQSALDFHSNYKQFKNEADAIIKKLNDTKINICKLQDKFKTLQCHDDLHSGQIYERKIGLLMKNQSKVKASCKILMECRDFLDYLAKGGLILQNETSQEIDLITLFEKFNLRMETHCLEMKTLTDVKLDSYIGKFTNCNEQMNQIKINVNDIYKNWINLRDEVKNGDVHPKNVVKINQKPTLFPTALSSTDSTVLAVPLDISESL